jgi:hypothetical protein
MMIIRKATNMEFWWEEMITADLIRQYQNLEIYHILLD